MLKNFFEQKKRDDIAGLEDKINKFKTEIEAFQTYFNDRANEYKQMIAKNEEF